MPYHLILTFEPFATFTAGAFSHWTIVRSILTVHIPMRTSFHVSMTCISAAQLLGHTSISIGFERELHYIPGNRI